MSPERRWPQNKFNMKTCVFWMRLGTWEAKAPEKIWQVWPVNVGGEGFRQGGRSLLPLVAAYVD